MMIAWLITIAVAFMILRSAVKMDIKHNDGWFVGDLDNIVGVIALFIVIILVPFVNILLSVIFYGMVLNERFESKSVDDFVRRLFFISKKSVEEKSESK